MPVIGVIIIDKQKQLYNFKIASDFVAEIALERCLNELHQGSQTFKSIPLKYYTFEEINNLNGPDSALINLEKTALSARLKRFATLEKTSFRF